MTPCEVLGAVELPGAARAPRDARGFVERVLAGHEALEDIRLCVSELVTNAYVHARRGGRISVVVTASGRSFVRVTVVDAGGAATKPCVRDDPDAAGGRGLGLVAALSVRWGAEATDVGWAVWAEFVS